MEDISQIISGFHRLAIGLSQTPELSHEHEVDEEVVHTPTPKYKKRHVRERKPPKHESFESIHEPYGDDYWQSLEEYRISSGDTEEEAREHVKENREIDMASRTILLTLKAKKFAYKPDLIHLTIDGDSQGYWFSKGNEYKPVKSHEEVRLTRSTKDRAAGIMKFIDDKLLREKDPMGEHVPKHRGTQYPDVVSVTLISPTAGDHKSGEWVYDGESYRKVNQAVPLEISLA